MNDVQTRYRDLAQNPDPLARRVAARQAERLRPRRAVASSRPARFQNVPIAALLTEAGNVVTERQNGTLVAGHEPVHGSKSGNCLVVWVAEARWWCSSCHASGDAAALVASLRGWNYGQSARWLRWQYGVSA
jgi:hypothetical protein